MSMSGAFRAALFDGDARRMVDIWRTNYPDMPVPTDITSAEIVMHRARTETMSLPLAKRFYSHQWLTERGYDSGLPIDLRARWERERQRIVAAVGISVNTPPSRAGLGLEIRAAMENVAGEMLADGVEDHIRIRHEMQHARMLVRKRLM